MVRAILAIALVIVSISLRAQTFTTLHNFTNTDGQFPIACLVSGSNALYGTSSQGGNWSNGTVFALDTDGGNFRVLHSFSTTDPGTGTNWDGAFPSAGLVLSGNTLYGVAEEGGTNGDGTVFSVGIDGSSFTVLHTFNGGDGRGPHARLLLSDGTLYGTTYWGGNGEQSVGTIFSVGTNGADFNVLHAFNGYPEGANPEGDVILVSNLFYGTTVNGGTGPTPGTVFSFDTNNVFTSVLHNFSQSDGSPHAGLIFCGGKLYGTAYYGYTSAQGSIFSINTDGSGYSVVHNFSVPDAITGTNPDGALPHADLLACGYALYGTTYLGGTHSNGVVFRVNMDGGSFAVLHDFTGVDSNYANSDGANSESSLIMVSNTLYGTATFGGTQGAGTIFRIQLPSISAITRNADGTVTISFVGGAPVNLVQAASNLTPPISWQTIATNAAGADGVWQFTDTNTSYNPSRFYRSASP